MQLSPEYRAQRFHQDVRDSLKLALKARDERALALLIDTAIECRRQEELALREAEQRAPRH